jgi:hypothetical protein
MARRGSERLDEQVTINLTPELRVFVARDAECNSRTVAGQIRHYVVEAARRGGAPTSEPWPPVLIPVGESLDATKTRLEALIRERDRLQAAEKASPLGLIPHHEERLRAVRDHIATMSKHVEVAERMMEPQHG